MVYAVSGGLENAQGNDASGAVFLRRSGSTAQAGATDSGGHLPYVIVKQGSQDSASHSSYCEVGGAAGSRASDYSRRAIIVPQATVDTATTIDVARLAYMSDTLAAVVQATSSSKSPRIIAPAPTLNQPQSRLRVRLVSVTITL